MAAIAVNAVGGPATILDALAHWAAQTSNAPVLLAPGLDAVTYGELHGAVGRLAGELRALGLRRGDGVAVAFPDGPEVCLALLAVMPVGVAVSLPWPAAAREHAALLANPRLRAVLAPRTASVSHSRGLPLIDWIGEAGHLGDSGIRGAALDDPTPETAPRAEGAALILRSSGSTGEPKRVPRTHGAIMAACTAMMAARRKTPADRCLSLARTAYSQGVNAWMYAIASGGSLVSAPAIVAGALAEWIAAAFGIPDARLGEDIAAAVVLAEGTDVSARELRRWLAGRLSLHKIPRRIWFVDRLPRTHTGMVRRGELARMWSVMRP